MAIRHLILNGLSTSADSATGLKFLITLGLAIGAAVLVATGTRQIIIGRPFTGIRFQK